MDCPFSRTDWTGFCFHARRKGAMIHCLSPLASAKELICPEYTKHEDRWAIRVYDEADYEYCSIGEKV